MKDTCSKLNELSNEMIPAYLKEDLPEVVVPDWSLNVDGVIDAISRLAWTQQGAGGTNTVKSFLFVRHVFNFGYFVGRTIHEFKIPTNFIHFNNIAHNLKIEIHKYEC